MTRPLLLTGVTNVPLLDPKDDENLTSEGYDTLKRTWYRRADNRDAALLGFSIGDRLLHSGAYWIQQINPRIEMGDIWRIEAMAKGLGKPRGWSIKISAGVETVSAEHVSTPEGLAEHLQALEGNVIVEFSRVRIGSNPETLLVGTALTPPVTFPVRTGYWSGLDEYTLHFPHDWVCNAINGQNLVDTDIPVWIETLVFQFYQARRPAPKPGVVT